MLLTNPLGPPADLIDLLAAAGDDPVIGRRPSPWRIGPFRFEVSTAALAPRAVWMDARAPASRVDQQLLQIENVAPGAGATNPSIALYLTGAALSVPIGVAVEVQRELGRRTYLRVQRGESTTFWRLFESSGNGAIGVSAESAAGAPTVGTRGSPRALIVPNVLVNLATDQVGIWYDGDLQLVLGAQPVPIFVDLFGAARESSGFQADRECNPGVSATPAEAAKVAQASVGHSRTVADLA